jgi:hypothetical protein
MSVRRFTSFVTELPWRSRLIVEPRTPLRDARLFLTIKDAHLGAGAHPLAVVG